MQQTIDSTILLGASEEELLRQLDTKREGLSESEARERLKQFGLNEIAERKHIRPFLILLSKFKNPLFFMLTLAAALSAFLGSRIDSVIILAMVFISALIDFANTYKSSRAVERLREQVNVTSAVVRGGTREEKKIQTIVPGDIIELGAGDLVPADCLLLESKDMFVNESALTGESVPVEKEAKGKLRELFFGTSVVSGHGIAVILKTGKATRMGKIARELQDTEEPSEFDRNLKEFSTFIFRVSFFLVLSILLINIFLLRKENVLEIFLFAVAIAVGLAPELLPVIVTTNLAKGAIKMGKGGVIVKKLSAIHDFGSMDILCTDKTGTLTEDRITLIQYLDGFGNKDDNVLFWGYVSSAHVSSIRGTLDKAVQNFKKLDIKGWGKIDEIPFDFERRRDSVVVEKANKRVLICKGAPEDVLSVSAFYSSHTRKFSETIVKKVHEEYLKLSADGFRVLGVAVKDVPKKNELYSKNDERGMTFLGFLAFLDPPKKTAKATLKKMADYNVAVKIITGDHYLVAEKIAHELDLPLGEMMSGEEIERLNEKELRQKVETVNLFTRVTPEQKQAIVQAFQSNGHVVGYLGDGVNDVLALKAAHVGISVSNAVDVAQETASLILLRKGLGEIIEGVLEGRKTFANIFKYLMMALSSNFGNMVSMPVASVVLDFLPMTATQILLNNFLYDTSQFTIPFDRVDEDFLKRAKRFDIKFIKNFMMVFGPLSSLFDFFTFLVLLKWFGLVTAGFQTGWFLESIATQTLVVGIIRTRKSFFHHPPSLILVMGTAGVVIVAWAIPFLPFGHIFGFTKPHFELFVALAGIVVVYLFVVEGIKHLFYKEWGALIEK